MEPENPTDGFPRQPQIRVTLVRVMLACTPQASLNSWIHNPDWYMAWPDTGIVTPTRFHSELARPTMMIQSISTPCGYPLCTVHPAEGLDRSTGIRDGVSR